MYTEFYCEQLELLSLVEKRLDEIMTVDITDSKVAKVMIEEFDYLMNYLKSTDNVSSEIKKITTEIMEDNRRLKNYLISKQQQFEGVKKWLV